MAHARRAEPEDEPRGGVTGFARWFFTNRFRHMEQYRDELEQDPRSIDAARVRERFERATRHGQRVLTARLVVTALLALGLATTTIASLLNAVSIPTGVEGDVERLHGLLVDVATIAASFSVLLLGLRLAFDRYLRLIETSALLLAMQLSAARTSRA